MNNQSPFAKLLVLSLLAAVCVGCERIGIEKIGGRPIPSPTGGAPKKLTQEEIAARLAAEGVNTAKKPEDGAPVKPNPLMLTIAFAGKERFRLNKDEFGDLYGLVAKLKEIREYREKNGILKEGTNEIEMKLGILADKKHVEEYGRWSVTADDFVTLVTRLRRDGFADLDLLLDDPVGDVREVEFPTPETRDSGNRPKTVPKTVSAGVINGKATNLVQPAYPAAARAVRASGAVNVQVTVDENGKVISASAVTGHPLLRAAAVEAARSSTFKPMWLGGSPVKFTGVIVYNFQP